MGTALVMEHANALAQMIVSEKDKLSGTGKYIASVYPEIPDN